MQQLEWFSRISAKVCVRTHHILFALEKISDLRSGICTSEPFLETAVDLAHKNHENITMALTSNVNYKLIGHDSVTSYQQDQVRN